MIGSACREASIGKLEDVDVYVDARLLTDKAEDMANVRKVLAEVVKAEMHDLKTWILQALRDSAREQGSFTGMVPQGTSSSSHPAVEELRKRDIISPGLGQSSPPDVLYLSGDTCSLEGNPAFRDQVHPLDRPQRPSKDRAEPATDSHQSGMKIMGIRTLIRRASKISDTALASIGFGAGAGHLERNNTRDTRQSGEERRLDWEEKIHRTVNQLTLVHEKVKEEVPDNFMARMVTSQTFNIIVALAILANAIVIAFDVENSMHRALNNPGEPKPEFFNAANFLFSGFFGVELLLNVFSLRKSFLFGTGWTWNLFDATLVLVSLFEVITAGENDVGYSRGFVRLLRVVRMARILRLLRILRFFSELRYMCMSMLSCLASLFWAMVLLLMVVFIFAIVFMHAGVTDLETTRENEEQWRLWYGSLGDTIMTLTKAISGGENWALLAEPLEKTHMAYGVLFTIFVMLFLYGALNVLTGVFMQRAVETMNHDRDWITQNEIIKMENFVKNLMTLFNELDIDCSGDISWPEFVQAMETPSTQAFFTSHQLDLFDAHLVFNTMAKGTGVVNLVEFVQGCSRASGYAKSAHLMALMKKTDAMHRDLKQALVHLDSGELHSGAGHAQAGNGKSAPREDGVGSSTCSQNG
eukprot:CAMPEP_0178419134 /NCGR_PEP_ID=MMETSP0689_2-20121128/25451_1 /TAXON_ID=160604 /ORGANISM="Amphidinium massartii, Strain CS-259" /LENGTH=639 /DNA_ID=CAMNT_0020040557 /DNA_START=169 /DNA_END=2085 /DNA_ORIENTATION=+